MSAHASTHHKQVHWRCYVVPTRGLWSHQRLYLVESVSKYLLAVLCMPTRLSCHLSVHLLYQPIIAFMVGHVDTGDVLSARVVHVIQVAEFCCGVLCEVFSDVANGFQEGIHLQGIAHLLVRGNMYLDVVGLCFMSSALGCIHRDLCQ